MGKGPKKDMDSMRNSLDVFVKRLKKASNEPEETTPPSTPTIKDTKKRKNNQVESEAEKLSSNDKAPCTDNTDNSNDMDIEITDIIPPKDVLNQCASKKRKEHLNKVVNMIWKLTPIGESKESSTNKDFRDVLIMMSSICQFLFDENGVMDWIVKENSQIRNVNQDLPYNDHVTRTRNDMEKLQRTVKVLDVDLDNSFPNGVIENMSSLRETMRSNLVKMRIPVDLLVGSVINVTSKVITNSTVPVAIITATKDKKIEIEKFTLQ